MTKILNPKECLRRFIEGKIQHNRELHEAGLKNLYFEWEDYGNDILNQSDLLESYVQECCELRSANEYLKKEIERLEKYKSDFYNLKAQFSFIQEQHSLLEEKCKRLEKAYSDLMNGNEENEEEGF